MIAVSKRKERTEKRLQAVLDATERIFADQTFGIPRHRNQILGDMPSREAYESAKEKIQKQAAGVSADMLPCWIEPLLSKEQEQHVSRKFNLLKALARDNALKGRLTRAEQFLERAQKERNLLTLANMRLAVNVIKRIYSNHKDDLLSEAYMAVYKSADYFDWRRGLKFSTYATWVISKNLWRTNAILQKEDGFQRPDFDFAPGRDIGFSQEIDHAANIVIVKDLLCHLEDERDREVVKLRYGIECRPLTLEECGMVFNVTKERIRQIQDRAIRKLRSFINASAVTRLKEVA